MGKESEVQKATELGFVYICFPRDTPPPAEPGLLAFLSGSGDPKQLSYGNGYREIKGSSSLQSIPFRT